eukprot:SM000029S10445  [mRNA]  locus=s29:147298:148534:- [translate_table: standard]
MDGGAGAGPSLPHLSAPHDALRHGLPALKQDALPAHAVEAILESAGRRETETQRMLLEQSYGLALPSRMAIDAQILARVRRLPGLPSSLLGLRSMTGELDDFGFEDYLDDPRESPSAPQIDVHHVMEVRLGLSAARPAQALP